MSSTDYKPMPVLPDLKLPLVPWLIAAPLACLIVGGLGYGVALAIGIDQPMGAVWGGVASAIGMLIAAAAVLPWIARPLNQWANLLLGGQLFAFVAVLGVGFVVWKATGTHAPALGLTVASGFLVGQLVQASVFQAAAKPIEKRLLAQRRAAAD
jgi:hypothetical protein